MIGVTIGIGQLHNALANVSAKCFTQCTGIEALVLGEKELKFYKLNHPASLKFKLFEILKEDNVVYFDSDWFCVKAWNPLEYLGSSSLVACNDFVLKKDWPEQYLNFTSRDFENIPLDNYNSYDAEYFRDDYIQEIKEFANLKIEHFKWINTGFWIANRAYQKDWLNLAFKYYTDEVGHHPQYYEQPAMNKALERNFTSVKYLPRKFNTLIATGKIWPRNLLGLHIKTKHHFPFIEKIEEGQIYDVNSVKKYLWGSI